MLATVSASGLRAGTGVRVSRNPLCCRVVILADLVAGDRNPIVHLRIAR